MPLNAIVIDDSQSDRDLARRVLSRSPFIDKIVEFDDASDAEQFLCDAGRFERLCGPHPPPTLVFVDINMTGLSGIELIEIIAARQREAQLDVATNCIVLMLTSSNLETDKEAAMRFNVVSGYVQKPLNREKLRRLIKQFYPELLPQSKSSCG